MVVDITEKIQARKKVMIDIKILHRMECFQEVLMMSAISLPYLG
jgi:hypothetical protein